MWHPISQESITEPKVSSITLCVDELEQREYYWKEVHKMDCDTGIPGQDRWYAPGYDPKVEDEVDHLIDCCGEPRPRDKNVKMTDSEVSEMMVQCGSLDCPRVDEKADWIKFPSRDKLHQPTSIFETAHYVLPFVTRLNLDAKDRVPDFSGVAELTASGIVEASLAPGTITPKPTASAPVTSMGSVTKPTF
ncbi:hypothetical protein DL98DRAFT_531059 [Cadophora sp. DSE1049]|nr:hypothetical protein DL98DRAFT_531059 [Cadophora sp. DSE1049]